MILVIMKLMHSRQAIGSSQKKKKKKKTSNRKEVEDLGGQCTLNNIKYCFSKVREKIEF